MLKGPRLSLIDTAGAENRETSPLVRLAELARADINRVETLIDERMQSPVGRIPIVAGHLIDAGGKRVRPLLTVSSAALFGYQGEGHIKLAAAVEFIHTATLLHDDVVDDSALRRGRSSANFAFGNASSVLVGDFLFARAFNLMVEVGSMKILDILATASRIIAEGEVRQLAAVNDVATNAATYLEIITAKTAALFAAASRIGPVLAGGSAAEEEAMTTYGREVGLAFQLVDDALDYDGATARMGKNTGDDFREGKVTMPIVIAFARADEEERAFWSRVVGGQQAKEDFETARTLLHRHGAIEETLAAARRHAQTAKNALAIAPPGPLRDALADLTDFIVARAY